MSDFNNKKPGYNCSKGISGLSRFKKKGKTVKKMEGVMKKEVKIKEREARKRPFQANDDGTNPAGLSNFSRLLEIGFNENQNKRKSEKNLKTIQAFFVKNFDLLF